MRNASALIRTLNGSYISLQSGTIFCRRIHEVNLVWRDRGAKTKMLCQVALPVSPTGT